MTEEKLKEWLRENLIIESGYESNMSDSLDQEVTFRFKGDDEPFGRCVIFIPND